MKISFDIDGTLGYNSKLQQLAKSLVDAGHDVWILTARQNDIVYDKFGPDPTVVVGHQGFNMDVRRIADNIGISYDKILFTGGPLKVDMYMQHKFDLHYDDDPNEVDAINKRGGMAFLVDMCEEDMKVYVDMIEFERGHRPLLK